MNNRDRTQLERIRDELVFIQRNVSGVDLDTFLDDEVLQHAVSMALVTIGECANHLSEEFIAAHPDMAWIQIIAVRNIAAHGYWQLDMTQIWQALEEDIPKLESFVSSQIE